MRELFQKSVETQQLVKLFVDMSINQTLSFDEASRRLSFNVSSSLSAYQSAKRIAMRDHECVIEGIKGIGFKRLDGSGMVKRGVRHLRAIRRRSRSGAAEQAIALRHNLDRNEQLKASEQFNRFRLCADVAANPATNRTIVHAPPMA